MRKLIVAATLAGAIGLLASCSSEPTAPEPTATSEPTSYAQKERNTKNEIRQLRQAWSDALDGFYGPAAQAEYQNRFVITFRRAVEYPDQYTSGWVALAREILPIVPSNPASAGWKFDRFVEENHPELLP